MSNVLDLIGRIFISALFLISAFNKIFNLDGSMGWMESFGVPVLVIVGYRARLASGILAIFCLVTAFIFHFDFSDQMQFILFLKNIGLAGGFLFIVANGTKDWAVDREKKYVRL